MQICINGLHICGVNEPHICDNRPHISPVCADSGSLDANQQQLSSFFLGETLRDKAGRLSWLVPIRSMFVAAVYESLGEHFSFVSARFADQSDVVAVNRE